MRLVPVVIPDVLKEEEKRLPKFVPDELCGSSIKNG